MTDFVGAIALAGDLEELLPESDRQAVARATLKDGESMAEFGVGNLWLRAPSNVFARERCRCAAAVGWLAKGWAVEVWRHADIKESQLPVGQYAMACLDADLRKVTLVRSPSGGERLYYLRIGELVLFASSIRCLLAYHKVTGKIDKAVLGGMLLSGLPNFGHGSLLEGIDEVMPAHSLTIGSSSIDRQHWRFRQALFSPQGPVTRLAREFRGALNSAVETAVGDQGAVAVALSGGIDSSAIAAAAVEVAGAGNVHAFTWEFDDPTHPTETPYAVEVAQRLGISHHRIFKVSLEEFISSIPQMVWHTESPVCWPKAFLLPVARKIRAEGFNQYLTGFGVGSHMGYLREFCQVLPFLPWPDYFLRYWKLALFHRRKQLEGLRRLHPGLEPPHPRLYHMMLRLLQDAGYIEDLSRYYPPVMKPLLELEAQAKVGSEESVMPLWQRLQLHAFAHLISCVDITRTEKASRVAGGVQRLSPAHFPHCIPYAYFAIKPPPFLWRQDRHKRPGKLLLQHAYKGILPDSVLYRKKSWDDAVISKGWAKEARIQMLRTVPGFPDTLAAFHPDLPAAMRYWEPRSINATGLSLAFWIKMFLEMPLVSKVPTWDQLWRRSPDVRSDLRRVGSD